MNHEQFRALSLRETDIRGAVHRCCEDEKLYADCLKAFLDDTTTQELKTNIAECQWDDAFTAAHALKGLAGNLGFVPLMHATGHLVILIRGGRTSEIAQSLEDVESCYRDILDAIRQFISYQEDEGAT